jgi:hypothetical protein
MSGSLIKIDEEIVTSAVASVTLGGSNWDSSYDVYMVRYNKVETSGTSAQDVRFRFLVSGTPDTSANYDYADKFLREYATFANNYGTNQTSLHSSVINSANSTQDNGILYLFNFNNASEYSFCTVEYTSRNTRPGLGGGQGGGVLTVAQATNGVQFFLALGDNIDSGHFVLYGLKK